MSGTDMDRLLAKTEKTDSCWLWRGAKNPRGYGWFSLNKKPTTAHRAAYEIFKGPIPEGMDIDHTCHDRGCVNPAHLRAITHRQNLENRAGAQCNSKSGVRGVIWSSQKNKWAAVVRQNGRGHYAGFFETIPEAEAAVIAKRNELFTHNDADRIAR